MLGGVIERVVHAREVGAEGEVPDLVAHVKVERVPHLIRVRVGVRVRVRVRARARARLRVRARAARESPAAPMALLGRRLRLHPRRQRWRVRFAPVLRRAAPGWG